MKKYLLKDLLRRKQIAKLELKKQKLKYLFKNNELPFNIRLGAQLKLNSLEKTT